VWAMGPPLRPPVNPVWIKCLGVAGKPQRCGSTVLLGGDRLERRLALEELGHLADRRQDDPHVSQVEMEILRGAPEFRLGYARGRKIAHAMVKLSGEPNRQEAYALCAFARAP
jgi:hypothetical protein